MRRDIRGLAVLALLAAAARVNAQVTIRLTSVPTSTPAGATVYVAGNFNDWSPGAPAWAMTHDSAGGYRITLPDSVRGAIEFKFTLGSWDAVELTAEGTDVSNRQFLVPATGAVTLDAQVAAWRDPRAPRVVRHTASASVQVLSDSFAMPQLGRTRRVWIYLPPGYASSRRRYPVIYMHDGQNVFDAATSGYGEWGVDESLDSLRALGDPGVIVVAVDHGGDKRLDEYNPWKAVNPRYGGGEGNAYVEFLVQTLKPYVDAHYRTRPDPAHTGIAGSSMGGLISLYAALAHPEVFGRAAIFSCSCWIARPELYAFARQARVPRPLPRLFFIVGARESADSEPVRDQRAMVDTLIAAGFPVRTAIRAVVSPDGEHREWFWRREFPGAYRWLFEERRTHPGPLPGEK